MQNPYPPKSLGSHRRFRVRNLLCESRSPGPVYIGEIRRCRFYVSGPCAQLLNGSHRRFRVLNLLCDAPRFSETAAPLGSHRRFRVRNLVCGASRFSGTAVPLGSHRRFPGGNPLCGPPGFPADQKGGTFPHPRFCWLIRFAFLRCASLRFSKTPTVCVAWAFA